MARPKHPLVDRSDTITKALELIDADGLEAFSLRKLAATIGVNAAALYHHFRDKDAILDGVRLRVIHEAQVATAATDDETWQSYLRRTAVAYRQLLLGHPNVAPLLAPDQAPGPFAFVLRDRVAAELLAGGVPAGLVVPIIDSIETLAFGSTVLNPTQRAPADRLRPAPVDRMPALARGVEAAPATADALFDVQLDAVIGGWSELALRW